jgi:hypothetical protein
LGSGLRHFGFGCETPDASPLKFLKVSNNLVGLSFESRQSYPNLIQTIKEGALLLGSIGNDESETRIQLIELAGGKQSDKT